MNRPCSKNRLFLIPSLLVLLANCLSPGYAAEVPLRAFNASYDMYQGGMHVATSELSLQNTDGVWRWRMSSSARGIYSLFIRKSPFTETSFTQTDDQIQLQQIIISDGADKGKYESANFDWDNGNIKVLRRGKQKQLALTEGVFDYQSIHLLAAAMRLQDTDKATVDFYRKGKLVKARFVYSGDGKVKIGGKSIAAKIFEQMTVKSNSKIKYYYDADNPLLPLRIEKLESGESPIVLTLKQVDWQL